jgi:signal transduction histidine kinase
LNAEATDRTQKLAAMLRAVASRAADRSSGGVALVFATQEDSASDIRLRAASGFAVADDARKMAHELLPTVRETLENGESRDLPASPELGDRAAAGITIYPLISDTHLHGAILVGSPATLPGETRDVLLALAESLCAKLDHYRIETECERLRIQVEEREDPVEDRSDEVLKLSEALFAQDIELLRSNEKLGKIERLKNDFIEKMSRELRTPLNGIIEAIISVLTSENEALSSGSKDALRQALDEGTSFLRTLQNILDLWKIKQGELPVEIQDVNFRELVDEAIFSVQDALGEKENLRIEPRIPESFPRVRTDLAKLSQILFLLLDNAAKFTEAGEIHIDAAIEEGRLVCHVTDTGMGICPDDQQLIFDEFFQVDEPSSQKYRGAGLGLTLVRDLIVLLDGEVLVKSDVGHGSRFTIRVPVLAA